MIEPSEKVKNVIYAMEKLGTLALVCIGVIWFLGVEFKAFRSDVMWKLDRVIRNERAIMQKLGIPIALYGDRGEPK